MLRSWLSLLLFGAVWGLHAAVIVDTGTAWVSETLWDTNTSNSIHYLCTQSYQKWQLYSLTIGAEGNDDVEDFLFGHQLKDHTLPNSTEVCQLFYLLQAAWVFLGVRTTCTQARAQAHTHAHIYMHACTHTRARARTDFLLFALHVRHV